ncbi:MAG: IPT/TIG domain-containing protein, partial [Bradyrhizobium sp.]|nr:IPT/TIG domain-containing protein [Bradyrhizobium sp.]
VCTITAVTPAGTAATNVPVVVTTSFGDSAPANIWTYQTPVTPPQAAPTLTSAKPSSGPSQGQTTVTLTGTNLTGATSVTFGGAPGTGLTVVSSTQITVVTPPAPAGVTLGTPVDIVVTTPATTTTTQTATLPAAFTYTTGAPTVTSVLANSGTTLGSNSVTISGTNFNGATAVAFGSVAVAAGKFTILSATTILATTPAQAAGTVNVTVTTPAGTSAIGTSDQYTYTSAPLPTITSISPASGDTAGNTQVTINGTNFVSGGSVTIGGNPTTLFTFVSSTQIKVTTAAHNPGVVDVVVTMPAGSVTGTGLYTYVAGPPTVTGISPANGPVAGGTAVQITGTNFFNVTNSTIGGVAPTAVTIVSATQITATTAAHAAGAVNVVVTTSAGSGTGINLFTYNIAPPTVTGASPNAGDIAGGTQVTITGTNFTGATAVTFGGTNALSVNVVSATQITATAPPHAAGLVNVVVTTPAGSGTGTGLFTFTVGAPKVTAVTPSAGPLAGGTVLTITGADFTGVTSVTIGGNPATAVTVVSATQITATTPPGAAFGPVNVVLTSPAGSGTGQGLFIYVGGAPTVTAVSPNAGPAAGGTSVTITGTNFVTGATSVTIGGVAAANVAVVSLTQITATTPAHAAGVVNVVATTPVGSGAGTGLFTYAGKATTSLNLTSSPNPSNIGQPVTFTAQVTGNNPTGSVTFTDNGTVIGSAPLVNGIATFTIATLPSGNNSVTASYPGDANNNPDPETVIQVVNAISDSVKLRQMQMAVMPMVTNLSGQAISGAIDSAISNGFGGACQMFSPNGGGFTYCYDGGSAPTTQGNSLAAIESNMLPDQKHMLEDDFKALGYSDDPAARKAPPMTSAREWLVWIDVRGADFNRTTLGSDLKGTQVNGTAGVTRLFTPNFLVGVVGGYEHFDFTSQAYSGKLTGDGYTAGGYVGWRPVSTIRFDASGAWSSITAADSAGTASGNFTGYRWFAGAGVTGTYAWAATVFEPSARVYMLWEQENAYTDTLGTLQASHNFDTGRGSVGMKVSHDFVTEFGAFVPYVGLYGDYYFSKDDANTTTTPGLTTVPLLQGGAARATGGVGVRFGGGAQLQVGGEYSGLGQDTRIWNLKLHGSVPF